jgi:hypothetical protein
MWLGNITEIQVKELEGIFAEYKGDDGWVIPAWLVYLKEQVTERDYGPNTR